MKRKQSHKSFNGIFITLLLLLFYSSSAIGQRNTEWAQSFKKCWTYSSERISSVQNASDNDLVFITSLPDKIQAMNPFSGEILWSSSLGGKITGKIIVNKDTLIVLNESAASDVELSPNMGNGNLTRSLLSLNSESGVINWKKELSSAEKIFIHSYESFVVLLEERGIVSLIDLQEGKTLQTFDLEEEISTIFSYNNTLVVGTFEKKIHFFSVVEGKFTRKISIEEIPEIIFIIDNEKIIWADKKGTMRSINTTTHKINWKKRFGGQISSFTNTSNGILVSSFDNFIYLVNVNNGKIKWRKRLVGRITEEPSLKDNIVIVFAYGDFVSLILELQTGKVIDLFSLSDANQFIGSPIFIKNLLVFPTLKGLFSFSAQNCLENKKTGE